MEKLNVVYAVIISTLVCLGGYLYNDLMSEKVTVKLLEKEKNELNLIINDLKKLNKKNSIKLEQSNILLSNLQNEFLLFKGMLIVAKTDLKDSEKVEAIDVLVKEESLSEDEMVNLQAFSKKIIDESNYDSRQDVDEEFEQEEVDHEWAYEYEQNVRELVQNDDKYGFDIQSLSCKTTACKLKMTADESNSMYLGAMLSKVIQEQSWYDKNDSINFNPVVTDGQIVVTVHRDFSGQ
ncbi:MULTISPECIES: hypothetical protein [unclassified Colwellia]|uniref:hypothetical protein n=1 Tax=unclassified Colwellia TaxID=196834 RepID=UPI0015F3BC52|nr:MULTISPECIES: hypothetical protein [unclassified Colwellia]MBA6348282.1 hypothetical protein [Colwellia sp. BRX8-9]MBA6354205.1 hypothetical protein [Colwellia sp. BRX9-1]MBA6357004.1 hypothetical protein [Colwellia sp. BRX8-3]MBA6360687.1 hypothetical protein [Colwellia sp. BRX8-6]MBA6369037.1 hypothetical protein [Colwellia sp. BRX8-5]